MALKYEKLADFVGNTGLAIGESEKALPQCAYRMAQYALLKFTGMKPQVLANEKLKLNAIWIHEHVKSLLCDVCQ